VKLLPTVGKKGEDQRDEKSPGGLNKGKKTGKKINTVCKSVWGENNSQKGVVVTKMSAWGSGG